MRKIGYWVIGHYLEIRVIRLIRNLVVIFLLFVILASHRLAFAQELHLSLSPPLVEILIKPGRAVTYSLRVRNEADSDVYLRAKVVPFSPDSKTGQIKYEAAEKPAIGPTFSLTNANIKLGDTFRLAAKSQQQLVLRVSVPASGRQKDYYYTFFIEHSPAGRFLTDSGSSAKAALGSHILISVADKETLNIAGKIASFSSRPKLADSFSSVTLATAVKNEGDYFFKAYGSVEIYDWLGKKRGQFTLRPDNVLSGSQRELVCLGQSPDDQTPPPVVPCDFSSLLPGPFHAKVTIRPNNDQQISFTGSTTFFLFPFRLLLVLLTASGLVAIILDKIRKRA